MPGEYIRSFDKGRQVALSALPALQAARPAHVLVLGTSGMMDSFYLGGILEHARGAPLDLAGMEEGERRVLADTSDVWASMMQAQAPRLRERRASRCRTEGRKPRRRRFRSRC